MELTDINFRVEGKETSLLSLFKITFYPFYVLYFLM